MTTSMTMSELVATYNELASQLGKPLRKGFENKARAEGAIGALRLDLAKVLSEKIAKTKAEAKAKAEAESKVKSKDKTQLTQPTSRGFRFGPVWIQSVRDGKGIALKPQNLPKLREHAKAVGVEVTSNLSQAEIAALISKAIASMPTTSN